MDQNPDEVIPGDVAAEFYFTAYLENLTEKDLQVLFAHYTLPSHEHLTWAQYRELKTFVEQWRQYGQTPTQAWQHWLQKQRRAEEPSL
jgi:hypothetical protein